MGHPALLVALVALTVPPTTSSASLLQLRSDLTILQAAIEAYRGQHAWHYPSAPTPAALLMLLKEEADLPETFQPCASFSEFQLSPDGYQISVGTGSMMVKIVAPKRYEPFWSFLW